MDYRAVFLTISFSCAIFSQGASAQDAVAELTLKGDRFLESLTKEASVSGRVVAGVLASNARPAQTLSLFSSPVREGEDVCVRVVSRDGLYWSENTFAGRLERRLTGFGCLTTLNMTSAATRERTSLSSDTKAIAMRWSVALF